MLLPSSHLFGAISDPTTNPSPQIGVQFDFLLFEFTHDHVGFTVQLLKHPSSTVEFPLSQTSPTSAFNLLSPHQLLQTEGCPEQVNNLSTTQLKHPSPDRLLPSSHLPEFVSSPTRTPSPHFGLQLETCPSISLQTHLEFTVQLLKHPSAPSNRVQPLSHSY